MLQGSNKKSKMGLVKKQCDGRGMCICNDGELQDYFEKPVCHFGCIPVKCPQCQSFEPQWVIDCHNNQCMNCHLYEYTTGKKWNSRECLFCSILINPINCIRSKGTDIFLSTYYHPNCLINIKNNM